MEYLGHIISEGGVSTDPKKIEAMVSWPRPATVKELRGFLGLTGYYRKFVQNYGVISQPLTELLRKDNFHWNPRAEAAFGALKKAMTQSPVLAFPDFSKTFVVETDACDSGVGAVLMQEGRPLAYISQGLAPRHLGLSVYDKELIAVLVVVDKWRHYLENNPFIIRTDHESLQFLKPTKTAHPIAKKRGLEAPRNGLHN